MTKNSFILAISLFHCIAAAAQFTLVLQPDADAGKDAFVHGVRVDDNFEDNSQLAAMAWTFDGVPGVIRSLLSFDLTSIPADAFITNASLSLYAIDTPNGFGQHSSLSGPNNAWIERITESWEESTVTWNTQPGSTTENRVSLAESLSFDQDYVDIDVTMLVEDMMENPLESFGFMLKLQVEQYFRRMNFCSSDHPNGAFRPRLIISYLPPVEPTCVSLRPDSSAGKDAFVHGVRVDDNFEDNSQLAAMAWTFDGVPGVIRSLLSFDLSSIPSDALITNASLSLYAIDTPNGFGQHSSLSGPNNAWIERITESWEESTVTWNTQPSSTTENRVSLDQSVSFDQDYLNINVIALVQDMMENPFESFGFMLKLNVEEYFRRMNFCSSDHPDEFLHPELEICYVLPTNSSEQEIQVCSVEIFPNPTSNGMTLVVPEEIVGSSLFIYDALGRITIRGVLNSEISTLNLEILAPGTYTLQIIGQESMSYRIIKE